MAEKIVQIIQLYEKEESMCLAFQFSFVPSLTSFFSLFFASSLAIARTVLAAAASFTRFLEYATMTETWKVSTGLTKSQPLCRLQSMDRMCCIRRPHQLLPITDQLLTTSRHDPPPSSYVLADRGNGQNTQVVKTYMSRHMCQNT